MTGQSGDNAEGSGCISMAMVLQRHAAQKIFQRSQSVLLPIRVLFELPQAADFRVSVIDIVLPSRVDIFAAVKAFDIGFYIQKRGAVQNVHI